MKNFLKVVLGTVLIMGLAGCSGSENNNSDNGSINDTNEASGKDETFKLSIAHITDENHTWHKASVKFKELVEAQSDGRISVDIYPNNTLGTEIDVIQSILTQGGSDITITGESMQTYAEELGILGMPYGIENEEHLNNVLEGEVGEELENLMIDSGLRPLATFVRGPRNITSNFPIESPDDLKDFVIRTPQSSMTVAAFEAMGAKPTPMAFSEVFTSLQSGVINGQENPLDMIRSGAFYEVQDYVNVTEHLRSWVYFAIGEKQFQSLPEDLQEIVLSVGDEVQVYEHELFLEEQDKLKEELISNGMEFIEVDQSLFAEKAISGVSEVLTEKQAILYEKIKDAK